MRAQTTTSTRWDRMLVRRLQPTPNVMHTDGCHHRPPRRRAHPRRKRRLLQAHLPAMFTADGKQLHDTVQLLRCPAPAAALRATASPGPWHLVNRRALSHDYGTSRVAVTAPSGTRTGRLRGLMPLLLMSSCVNFHTPPSTGLWSCGNLHCFSAHATLPRSSQHFPIDISSRPTPCAPGHPQASSPRPHAAAHTSMRVHLRQRFGSNLNIIQLQLPALTCARRRFLRRLLRRHPGAHAAAECRRQSCSRGTSPPPHGCSTRAHHQSHWQRLSMLRESLLDMRAS